MCKICKCSCDNCIACRADTSQNTGNKVFETEELFTAFSDEIVDGGLAFNEGVFGKIP